jgi:hypothetical protein
MDHRIEVIKVQEENREKRWMKKKRNAKLIISLLISTQVNFNLMRRCFVERLKRNLGLLLGLVFDDR